MTTRRRLRSQSTLHGESIAEGVNHSSAIPSSRTGKSFFDELTKGGVKTRATVFYEVGCLEGKLLREIARAGDFTACIGDDISMQTQNWHGNIDGTYVQVQRGDSLQRPNYDFADMISIPFMGMNDFDEMRFLYKFISVFGRKKVRYGVFICGRKNKFANYVCKKVEPKFTFDWYFKNKAKAMVYDFRYHFTLSHIVKALEELLYESVETLTESLKLSPPNLSWGNLQNCCARKCKYSSENIKVRAGGRDSYTCSHCGNDFHKQCVRDQIYPFICSTCQDKIALMPCVICGKNAGNMRAKIVCDICGSQTHTACYENYLSGLSENLILKAATKTRSRCIRCAPKRPPTWAHFIHFAPKLIMKQYPFHESYILFLQESLYASNKRKWSFGDEVPTLRNTSELSISISPINFGPASLVNSPVNFRSTSPINVQLRTPIHHSGDDVPSSLGDTDDEDDSDEDLLSSLGDTDDKDDSDNKIDDDAIDLCEPPVAHNCFIDEEVVCKMAIIGNASVSTAVKMGKVCVKGLVKTRAQKTMNELFRSVGVLYERDEEVLEYSARDTVLEWLKRNHLRELLNLKKYSDFIVNTLNNPEHQVAFQSFSKNEYRYRGNSILLKFSADGVSLFFNLIGFADDNVGKSIRAAA